jgi:hypothetical protein
MSGFKEREITKLRESQAEIVRRLNNWPIFASDTNQSITGLGFWIDHAIECLEKVDWANHQPLMGVEQVAAENIQKQTPETAEVVTV